MNGNTSWMDSWITPNTGWFLWGIIILVPILIGILVWAVIYFFKKKLMNKLLPIKEKK
tara:strand:+ start:394 stop:567 length:174 start_codon:yes stop_codon:yes gene_type:complete